MNYQSMIIQCKYCNFQTEYYNEFINHQKICDKSGRKNKLDELNNPMALKQLLKSNIGRSLFETRETDDDDGQEIWYMKEKVVDILKKCNDPELPIDLWNLGLIYDLNINQNDYNSIKAMFAKDEEAIYRILEVSPSATDSEVKIAYRKMANKYHPDKVAHLGQKMQTIAEEKFKSVNDAYQQIKKDRNLS